MKTILPAALLALAALLAACKHKDPPKPQAAITTAKQACEIDSLAREHEVVIEKLQATKDESKTIVAQKLKEFRGEIDASYRFVVENCTNYNLCMQARNWDENACSKSREAWAAAHTKFNELAKGLAELEVPKGKTGGKRGKPKQSGCCGDEVFTTGCCSENY